MIKNFNIPNSLLLNSLKINDFHSLIHHVQKLPYGRNTNRYDLDLVIKEGKGTCSSKHAFLKKIANENGQQDIQLILGFYKMNQKNTPGIGDVLAKAKLEYLPEGHCYLKCENQRYDFTDSTADIKRIEDAILLERAIEPEDVVALKVELHQDYLKQWIDAESIPCPPEASSGQVFRKIWELRERCIANLQINSPVG